MRPGTAGPDLAREFDLIARHFRPLAGPAARHLEDDAAVLDLPAGRQLVISADAMNEGVHWLAGTDPALVARKLLRVNLSDLAAMGAAPLGYMLTIAAPADTAEDWFAGFSAGLAQDQQEFGISLLGGDSTSITGPFSLCMTILGSVATGQAIGRGGARPGDEIFVTGTIGDGALGLAAARGDLPDPTGYLAGRYHLPSPRLGVADGIARAAIDVSDGLFAELGHLCRASGAAVEIDRAALPFSAVGRAATAWREKALAGGDDYELLMAVAPELVAALAAQAGRQGVTVTRIGRFVAGAPTIRLDGQEVPARGWSHFGA